MSVLIRGMVMPQCCGECKFMVDRWCYASEDAYFVVNKRHPDCPLVEVPTPHGRLIDADILTERFENLAAQALDYVGKLNEQEGNHELWRRWSTIWAERSAYTHDLYDAPTVIESEE